MKKFAMLLIGVFQVLVDYSITLDEIDAVYAAIMAGRDQGFTSKEFLSNSKGTTPVSLILVEFVGEISSREVLNELERKGLRAATAAELLAFGEKRPDSISNFHVAALGSAASRVHNRYLRLLSGDNLIMAHGDSLREFKIRYLAVIK